MNKRGGFTLLELLISILILSVIFAALELFPKTDSSRHCLAVMESQKIHRWLTNCFQQSIMYGRPFYIKIYEHASDGVIKIVWSQPAESEIYRTDGCFFNVNGVASRYHYSPSFRTLSPAVTVTIYSLCDDGGSVAKIVFPVKGFPRLEML